MHGTIVRVRGAVLSSGASENAGRGGGSTGLLSRNFTKNYDEGKACKNLVKNVLALFTILYYNHDKNPVCCLRFCYFYLKRV